MRPQTLMKMARSRAVWGLGRPIAIAGVAALTIARPAGAGGSSSLSDWRSLLGQSPELWGQVEAVLGDRQMSPDIVPCVGVRLGRQFGPLGAARITPIDCQFGEWMLRVEAQVRAHRSTGAADDEGVPIDRLLEMEATARSRYDRLGFELTDWHWYRAPRDHR